MSVTAKFKCIKVSHFETSKEVILTPVMEGNSDFSKYTPSGELKMQITNETKAADYFKPGKVYSLLIEEDEA